MDTIQIRFIITHFVNQHMTIDKTCSNTIWEEWWWFWATLQLFTVSFLWVISLGGGSTVTSLLPEMPKAVLGGCLATLVSFVIKVFWDCTMENFVFVFIGDLKWDFYLRVRIQQISCSSCNPWVIIMRQWSLIWWNYKQ